MEGTDMEETLYSIEIRKEKDVYIGRIYSDVDGVKEFRNPKIEGLLREIAFDIQLALDAFSARSADFSDEEQIEEF